MKKLFLAVVLVVASLGFTACEPDPKMLKGRWELVNPQKDLSVVLELDGSEKYILTITHKDHPNKPYLVYGTTRYESGHLIVNGKIIVKVHKLTSTDLWIDDNKVKGRIQKWKKLKE